MTKDDIIKLAREAGLFTHKEVQPELLAFANLVAEHEREACAKVCSEVGANGLVEIKRFAALVAAAERDACAKVCSEAAIKLFSGKSRVSQIDRHTAGVLQDTAKAIRARGTT